MTGKELFEAYMRTPNHLTTTEDVAVQFEKEYRRDYPGYNEAWIVPAFSHFLKNSNK